MGWTDERVELLKKLWADGLSASQIAGELGGVTRNAVIGKVHRLGLAGRAKSTRSATPRPRAKPRAAKPTPRLPQFSGNAALRMDTEELPAPVAVVRPLLEEIVIPVENRATILEINEHRCKWPVGDPTSPDFYFCGQHSGAGSPYCEQHAKVAYQPSNERRRERSS
ncbi:MAG: GcrA cell cycle regulator [Rhodobiaceae bacterium]|nr:GcrA cell cycle regulator [Rhodobiaceae bacterium]MCC0053953.1 GcrA cell cycle regulator [Rhodobiaceae bacterium]